MSTDKLIKKEYTTSEGVQAAWLIGKIVKWLYWTSAIAAGVYVGTAI